MFRDNGDTVTLTMTMTHENYDYLLLLLGIAAGSVSMHSRESFRDMIRFVNRLNEGNPNFTPYEVPAL